MAAGTCLRSGHGTKARPGATAQPRLDSGTCTYAHDVTRTDRGFGVATEIRDQDGERLPSSN